MISMYIINKTLKTSKLIIYNGMVYSAIWEE